MISPVVHRSSGPGAATDDLVALMREHLAPGGRRGVLVIAVDYTDVAAQQKMWMLNAGGSHFLLAATNLLAAHIEGLRGCGCGGDHRLQIAELEAVVSRLSGNIWPGEVPN